MNNQQLERMRHAKGFIAALDQSGGSTPKALANYGIEPDQYTNDEEMFNLVHQMRTRIITSPSFTSEKILAAILFEKTMDDQIEGKMTGDFLWEAKGIVPIIKIDKGLADLNNGVQLMKPMPELDSLLERSVERKMFGTKMRSVIKELNLEGIKAVIDQQFEVAKQIWSFGLVPIIEPEVDINCPDKAAVEKAMLAEINNHMANIPEDMLLMFKITIPTEAGLYSELMTHPQVVRVVALSGGYSLETSNELLAQNHKLIASFSRALSQNLNANQTAAEFDKALADAIDSIYEASIK